MSARVSKCQFVMSYQVSSKLIYATSGKLRQSEAENQTSADIIVNDLVWEIRPSSLA